MDEAHNSSNTLLDFLRIEANVRSAWSTHELGFIITNETYRLVPYRQAFFCTKEGHQFKVSTISGLASVDTTTPFHDWFQKLLHTIVIDKSNSRHKSLTFDECPVSLTNEWLEWLPKYMSIFYLRDRQSHLLGLLILVDEKPLNEQELSVLDGITEVYEYALAAIRTPLPWYKRNLSKLSQRIFFKWGLLAFSLVFLIPIRQTSLGTAEVTPLSYTSITAPLDGVIAALLVKPNEQVFKNQPLFRLEETTIKNKLKTAELALDVARSEEFTTRQKAFWDQQSKGEIATHAARVRERGSNISYMHDLMGKLGVRAPSDGIVLYGDPTDWEGRPVTTGERIMLLADPLSAGITLWIPVKEAVSLDPGKEVQLFLNNDPLQSHKGIVISSSYQPILSPEGISSYRVTAKFAKRTPLPRIGLRGTGKVYGQWSILGYQVFRRPLLAFRQKLGI